MKLHEHRQQAELETLYKNTLDRVVKDFENDMENLYRDVSDYIKREVPAIVKLHLDDMSKKDEIDG